MKFPHIPLIELRPLSEEDAFRPFKVCRRSSADEP
jgi:hypothetical protein